MGDERLASVAALDADRQATPGTVRRGDGASVAVAHLGDADAQLVRQRLDQRLLHDPSGPAEPATVVGQRVVCRQAPELRLVLLDDAVDGVVRALRAVDRLTSAAVAGALGVDHASGHFQADRAVARALADRLVTEA